MGKLKKEELDKAQKNDSRQQDELYVIGIGASAGGLEAIHEFFDNVPEKNDLAFVIIQHLSADYKSLMAELLSKHTKMKVSEAKDGMQIEKNCVYVIPNKNDLIMRDGKLVLVDKSSSHSPNTAIDIFLESLAQEKENKAIAVILSGTGTDGTKGIEAIQSAGGLVIVQDPLTAKFDGMPNSAIGSGRVDYILPPELMYEEISHHIKQGPLEDTFPEIGSGEHENLLLEIMELIRNYTSYDFSYYKRPTINRRIIRRMVLSDRRNLKDYVEYLYNHPEEIILLSKEFLIGVTKFFRDTEAWEIIQKKIIPDLVVKKHYNDLLKIWVAGCSTGEEAYTLAILIKEEIARTGKDLNVKIFATDIDKESLEVAAKGLYPESIVEDVSTERLDKFFVKEGNKYLINPHIRKMVIFANHDIVKDPPFSRIDIVSCRNLLIYLNPILQKKVMSTFHFSLNQGGYLFLGSSETVGDLKNSLLDIDKKWKIYKNIQISKGIGFEGNVSGGGYSVKSLSPPPKPHKNQIQQNFTEVLNDAIMEEFGYSGVYVDENFDLIHAVGDFKKFIQLPDKKLNLNILKMIPEELTIPVGSALRKALKENERTSLKNIRVKINNSFRLIDISVKPCFNENRQMSRFILILFSEARPAVNEAENANNVIEYYNTDQANNVRIKDLEFELKETKENLQSAIEELETSNEELQSANEELLSANEELQSTNEELQSLNEELHTINSEHQLKIKELMDLNDDLNNYFRTSEISQVFVDKNLNIRKYTPSAVQQINLIETDIGRPINHISNNIRYEKLLDDIKVVLNTHQSIEKEIQLNDSKWFLMRIAPYMRQDNRMDGVVVTFLDVSKLKELNEVISSVLNGSLSGIIALKALRNNNDKIIDFQFIIANTASGNLLARQAGALIGKRLLDEVPEMKTLGLFEKYVEVVQMDRLLHMEKMVEWNGIKACFNIGAVKMGDGLVVTLDDITEKKEAEEKLQQANLELQQAQEDLREMNQQLEKRVEARTIELKTSEDYLKQSNDHLTRINNDLDNFIYTASHDLRAPISNIEGLIDALDSVTFSDPADKEAREILELMRFSVEKFKGTIKDLTEISRIQKEKTEDIEEIDIEELLNEVKDGIKEMINSTGAVIKEDLKERKIPFSRKNLRSVFYNLLSNAIKYRSPERAPEISLSTQKQDGVISFTIRDNGMGIPQKHQGKVFTMFKRFHDHVDGTGVGLYIVKRILDNQGASIKFESAEGKGTAFQISFRDKEETIKGV